MRSDPTDTGGLFVGRRPGTAPIRYQSSPKYVGERRQRRDALLASMIFTGMAVLCGFCWGPIPVAALWLGSRLNYLTGNVEAGIAGTFASAGFVLYGDLAVLQRLDHAWVLVRRASGKDQRKGVLPRIFAVTAAVGAVVFSFWFLVILGPNDPNL
jgi:hypothetical protein